MPTILFADDYASIRELLKQELELEGYRVLVACDGQEAIEMFRSAGPDLVVLDVAMPRLSGLDAAQAIAAIAPRIPIILFSNNDELCGRDPRRALAVACVEKGKDIAELKQTVAAVLGRGSEEGLQQ